VAGDISAWFGRSAGFRQQGSMNQFDAERFDIYRLLNRHQFAPTPVSYNGRLVCLFDPMGQEI
jgi:hypothetical protein